MSNFVAYNAVTAPGQKVAFRVDFTPPSGGGFEDVKLYGWKGGNENYDPTEYDEIQIINQGPGVFTWEIGNMNGTYYVFSYDPQPADPNEYDDYIVPDGNIIAPIITLKRYDQYGSNTIFFSLTVNNIALNDGVINVFNRSLNPFGEPTSGICFSGLSLVESNSNGNFKLAKDVCSGDMVKNHRGDFVPVIKNVVTSAEKYVVIRKNYLSENHPFEDFYVTGGHPILVNGVEVESQELVNVEEKILDKPEEVYTIITKERDYININGLDVCTWEETDFEHFKNKYNLIIKYVL